MGPSLISESSSAEGGGPLPPGEVEKAAAVADATRSVFPALGVGLAVAAVCLGFVHATTSDAYWTTDSSSKALVAERLLETRYRDPNFDYPAAALDPLNVAFPLAPFSVPRAGGFVSVFPIAYPAIAAPFLAALGPAGLRWPAALGTGACAMLFAIWLMPSLGRRIALGAGAVFGLATPLFFYGVTVWEHSLTVALVLLAAVLLQRSGSAAAVAAGAAVGLASWLREELVLMGVALVVVEQLRLRDNRRTFALAGAGPSAERRSRSSTRSSTETCSVRMSPRSTLRWCRREHWRY